MLDTLGNCFKIIHSHEEKNITVVLPLVVKRKL